MFLNENSNPKRRDTLMDFIVPLLEDLGMAFVKIGADFIDHLDQFDQQYDQADKTCCT